jgi:hypothetical protein
MKKKERIGNLNTDSGEFFNEFISFVYLFHLVVENCSVSVVEWSCRCFRFFLCNLELHGINERALSVEGARSAQ